MILTSSSGLQGTDLHFADSTPPAFEHLLDFKTFASLRRMVAHQQSKPLLKRSDFMKQVTLYLPEVAELIEESDFGIVHLEVGAMRIATAQAIAQRDMATLRKHLLLVADLFERADRELHEALRISYLEALFLDEHSAAHQEARGLLSRAMESALRQAEQDAEKLRAAPDYN